MAFKKGVIPWNKGQTAAPITEETRAKMRAAHTGHPSGMKGKTPWNKGLTKETDARVATISYENHPGMSGKTHSPEAKAKISAALSGRKLSEETKQKLSEARKRKTPIVVKAKQYCSSHKRYTAQCNIKGMELVDSSFGVEGFQEIFYSYSALVLSNCVLVSN